MTEISAASDSRRSLKHFRLIALKSFNQGRAQGRGLARRSGHSCSCARRRLRGPPQAESQSESSGAQAASAAGFGAAASRPDRALSDRRRCLPELRALFRLGGRQGRLRARDRRSTTWSGTVGARIFTVLMLVVGGLLVTGTSISTLFRGIGRGLRRVFLGSRGVAQTAVQSRRDRREEKTFAFETGWAHGRDERLSRRGRGRADRGPGRGARGGRRGARHPGLRRGDRRDRGGGRCRRARGRARRRSRSP